MSHEVIVIDCQVLQTSAWTRGMGRYLASLIMGIYEHDDHPEVHLLFSKNLKTTPDCLEVINKVAPTAHIAELGFPSGLSDRVEEENSRIFDAYISQEKLEGALFINGSLFSFDYQPAFPTLTTNACIFYDMIPLKQWETFYRYFPAQEYFKRFKHLFSCDYVLAISEASRDDLLQYLALRPEKVINIAGAEIPHFMGSDGDHPTEAKKDYRYILLPGGNSPHKNMLRAIRGFDKFNGEFGDTFKLVVTSFYSEENIQKMQDLSSNIVLTGNVSDEELHALYRGAEAILFPSLDEGLGLPVLEAAAYNKPVVCSGIKAFKEISKKAFYFFDPYSPEDIATALTAAITRDSWDEKVKLYPGIKKRFTWANSAAGILRLEPVPDKPVENAVYNNIIVEQAGDMDTLKKISQCLSGPSSFSNITLFIDGQFERSMPPGHIPVIFTAFMRYGDLVDAPKKAQGSSVVVLTNRSNLSVPIGLSVDARFCGEASEAKHAVHSLMRSFKADIGDGVEDRLTETVKNRLVTHG